MDRKLFVEVEANLRRRIAANVRRLRQKKGFTLKVAGERAELHWRLWQKIEAAQTNATLFTVVRLANALDADPRELLAEPPGDVPPGG
jgi:transcriptional regulator with XRE-family HTH domain